MNIEAVPSGGTTAAKPPQADSGMAALAMLASHHRVAFDQAHARHELNLSDRPASVDELTRAARKVGLKAKSFRKRGLADLADAPRPMIVQMNNLSFLILLAIDDQAIRLLDPLTGTIEALAPDAVR